MMDSLIEKIEAEEISISKKIINKYLEMPLNLPISDARMRRVCQVLTNNNYITTESCEGHGKDYPSIFLKIDTMRDLQILSFILNDYSRGFNYNWQINVSYNIFQKSTDKYSFHIAPFRVYEHLRIDPKKDRDKLLEDVDLFGLYIMKYFSNKLWNNAIHFRNGK